MVSKMLRFRKPFLLILFLAAWSLLSVGCGGDADFFELPEDDDVFELPEDDDLFEIPGDEDGANGVSPPQAETISGSGSDVVPFTVGTSDAVTFQLVHSGDGAFIVWLLDSSAERVTLLTAKVGDVSDIRVENLAADSYLLDIDSTGEWSVSITGSSVSFEMPVDEDGANGVPPPQTETISGSGSDVVPFTVGTSGAVTFQLVHSGDGAFIVRLLDSSAERITLLTAKVGDVSDTRVANLDVGSYLLDIDSTGDWSVSIRDSSVSQAGSSVSIAGSAGGDAEAASPSDSGPETLPLITFAAPGQTLSVPLSDFRNVALILDPERGPAPAEGLLINYLLVDDPGLIQKIGMAERLDSDSVEGRSSIEGVVEANNAQSITIPGGDFAVTFQVEARNPGTALLILVGGHGYLSPTWTDSLGTLTIFVPDEEE